MSTDYNWDKYHGKTVVLVENDNPWFVNSDTTTQQHYNTNDTVLNDNIEVVSHDNVLAYGNNLDYKSNFVMDTNSPNLGYGYSFASRKGVPCNKNNNLIEGFGTPNNDCTDMQIIALIVFMAIVLMLYKLWKNNK